MTDEEIINELKHTLLQVMLLVRSKDIDGLGSLCDGDHQWTLRDEIVFFIDTKLKEVENESKNNHKS